jgi:hypothetical protein
MPEVQEPILGPSAEEGAQSGARREQEMTVSVDLALTAAAAYWSRSTKLFLLLSEMTRLVKSASPLSTASRSRSISMVLTL